MENEGRRGNEARPMALGALQRVANPPARGALVRSKMSRGRTDPTGKQAPTPCPRRRRALLDGCPKKAFF